MENQESTNNVLSYCPIMQDGKVLHVNPEVLRYFENFMQEHRQISDSENLIITNSRVSCSHYSGAISITDDKEYHLFLDIYTKIFNEDPEYLGLNINESQNEIGPLLLDFDLEFPAQKEFIVRQYDKDFFDNLIVHINKIFNQCFNKTFTYYIFQKPAPTVKYNNEDIQRIKDGFHLCIYEPFDVKTRYYLRYRLISYALLISLFKSINCNNEIKNIIDEATIERNGWMLYGSRKYVNKQNPREGSQCYYLTKVYHGFKEKKMNNLMSIDYPRFFSIHRFKNMEPLECLQDIPNYSLITTKTKKPVVTDIKKSSENVLMFFNNYIKTEVEHYFIDKSVNYEISENKSDCAINPQENKESDIGKIKNEWIEKQIIKFINLIMLIIRDHKPKLAEPYETWWKIGFGLARIESFLNVSLYPFFRYFSLLSEKHKQNFNDDEIKKDYANYCKYLNKNIQNSNLYMAVCAFKSLVIGYLGKDKFNISSEIINQYQKLQRFIKPSMEKIEVKPVDCGINEEVLTNPTDPEDPKDSQDPQESKKSKEPKELRDLSTQETKTDSEITLEIDPEITPEITLTASPDSETVSSLDNDNNSTMFLDTIKNYFNRDFIAEYNEISQFNNQNRFIMMVDELLTKIIGFHTDENINEITDTDLAKIIFVMFHKYYRLGRYSKNERQTWVFYNGIWQENIMNINHYIEKYLYNIIQKQYELISKSGKNDQINAINKQIDDVKKAQVDIKDVINRSKKQLQQLKNQLSQTQKELRERQKEYQVQELKHRKLQNEINTLESIGINDPFYDSSTIERKKKLSLNAENIITAINDEISELQNSELEITDKIQNLEITINQYLVQIDMNDKMINSLINNKMMYDELIKQHDSLTIFNRIEMLKFLRRAFGNQTKIKIIKSLMVYENTDQFIDFNIVIHNPENTFDQNNKLFNFADCTINLLDDHIESYNHTPDDMLTFKASVPIGPMKPLEEDKDRAIFWKGEKNKMPANFNICPNKEHVQEVENYFCQLLPDKEIRTYFLHVLSSAFHGATTANKFFILTGRGSNGKSVLCTLIKNVFSDYFGTLPGNFLTEKESHTNNASPALMEIQGKRIIVHQEIQAGEPLNEARLKRLTGDDLITGRKLYKDQVTFRPQATFIMCCNDLPSISTDPATWRRLVIIDFKSRFVDNIDEETKNTEEYKNGYIHLSDTSIDYKVKSKEWRDALTYLLLVRYYKDAEKCFNKHLQPPDIIQNSNRQRQIKLNSIRTFILEFCVVFDKRANIYEDSQKDWAQITQDKTEEEISEMYEPEEVGIRNFMIAYQTWYSDNHRKHSDPYGTTLETKILDDGGVEFNNNTKTIKNVHVKRIGSMNKYFKLLTNI